MMRTSARQGRSRRGRGGSDQAEAVRKSFMVTEGGIVQTEEQQEKAAVSTITTTPKAQVKTGFSPSLLGTLKKEKKGEVVTETGASGAGEPDKRILRVFDSALRF